MKMIENRYFKIWAYTVSHNTLILRSPMKHNDQDDYSEELSFNIDIEFSAVAYVDLPSSFLGFTIKEMVENVPAKFVHYKLEDKYKVFEIISNGNSYFVVAGSYRIGTNKWFSEDRIFNIGLDYDEILATS